MSSKNQFCVDFDWMAHQVRTQRLSVSEIARAAGVCRHTVHNMITHPQDANPRLKTCKAVQSSIENLVEKLESARQEA
jgi:DNA-binding phage protein